MILAVFGSRSLYSRFNDYLAKEKRKQKMMEELRKIQKHSISV